LEQVVDGSGVGRALEQVVGGGEHRRWSRPDIEVGGVEGRWRWSRPGTRVVRWSRESMVAAFIGEEAVAGEEMVIYGEMV
jgi:hypothetical protein